MKRRHPSRAIWALAFVALCGAPAGAQRVAPQISVAPHHPGWRDVGAGTAQLAYATPAYVSRDQPRSIGLFYTSGQAAPLGYVQVDATDVSADPPQRMALYVVNPWGYQVTSETSFAAGSGVNRLAAVLDGIGYGTGARLHHVVVRSYWADGTILESTADVRVAIINESASPFGAGWGVAGLQRAWIQGDGVFVTNGDGSGTFFTLCTGCGYTSPDGEFSTLTPTANGELTRTYPDGSRVVFRPDGLMSYSENRIGERTTWTWKTVNGTMVPDVVTDPAGKQTVFGYNAGGFLATITDPMGRVSQVTYSGTDVYRVTGPDSRAAFTATYDAAHKLTSWNDAAGGRWDVTYDRGLMLATVTAPQVNTTDAGATRPVTTIHSLMDAVLVQPGYGFSGQPPSPRVVPANIRVWSSDPRGNVVRAAVDRYGAPTRIEEPYGRVTTIDRNQHAQITRTVSPTGHTVTATWNGVELTRVVDETVHDTATADYEHTWHQPTYVHRGMQRDSMYYNASGLLQSTVSLGGGTPQVQQYSYWPDGRLYSITDPAGHGTFYSYEGTANGKLDNLAAVEAGVSGYLNNRITTYAHDALGRDTMTTSPNADKSRLGYDLMNRVVRSTDPVGNSTYFAFDSAGLATVTDAKSEVYRFTRNPLGWVVSETDPRNASISYGYDRAGNLTSTTNRRAQAVTLTYDSLNRVTSRNAGGAVTTWSYDPAGLWSQVSNAESTDRAEFDAAGRLLQTVVTRGGTTYRLQNTLDTQGRRRQLAVWGPWAGAYTNDFRYDDRAQLDTLIDFYGGRTLMGYDADGLWTGPLLPMNTGLGFGIGRSHVSTHVPYEITHPSAVADVLNTSYTLDKNGLLAARSQRFTEYYAIGSRVNTYAYDRLGRLTRTDVTEYYDSNGAQCGSTDPNLGKCIPANSVPYAVETRSYNWDATGNPLGANYTVDTGNRLTRTSPFTLEYDADGNLTRKYRTDAFAFDQRLFWNALGQLDSVRTNGTVVRYGYNGLGQRIRAGTKQFLYDGDDLLMEMSTPGVPDHLYTYYPGVDNPHSMRMGNGPIYYYTTDFPGNVVALVNKNREIVAQYTYDDFGHSTAVADSTGGQPLRYAGRELDPATGLYYMRARWYDPDLARFVSEDPAGLQAGPNPYTYVFDNPVNGRDPSGLDPCRDAQGNKIKQGSAQDCALPLAGVVTSWWPFSTPISDGWSINLGSRGGGPLVGRPAPSEHTHSSSAAQAEAARRMRVARDRWQSECFERSHAREVAAGALVLIAGPLGGVLREGPGAWRAWRTSRSMWGSLGASQDAAIFNNTLTAANEADNALAAHGAAAAEYAEAAGVIGAAALGYAAGAWIGCQLNSDWY